MKRFVSFMFLIALTGCGLPIFQRTYADEHPEQAVAQSINDAEFSLSKKFNATLAEYMDSREAPESVAAAVVAEFAPEIDDVAELRAEELKQRLSPDAQYRALEFRQAATEQIRQRINEDAIAAIVKHRMTAASR